MDYTNYKHLPVTPVSNFTSSVTSFLYTEDFLWYALTFSGKKSNCMWNTTVESWPYDMFSSPNSLLCFSSHVFSHVKLH